MFDRATVLLDISAVGGPLFFMFMQRRIRLIRKAMGLELIVPLEVEAIIPPIAPRILEKTEG